MTSPPTFWLGGGTVPRPPTKTLGGGRHVLYPPNHDGSAVTVIIPALIRSLRAVSVHACFLQAPQFVYFATYHDFEWKIDKQVFFRHIVVLPLPLARFSSAFVSINSAPYHGTLGIVSIMDHW